MADEKKGFLAILQKIPFLGGGKPAQSAEYPDKGPVETLGYNPAEKVAKSDKGSMMFPHRIKYKGMFDLEGLYRVMARWFKDKRFELHENLYKSKPPELELRWRAERNRTSYIQEVVTVYVHMWGEYNVEAVVNGKKKKMARVRMVITINGGIYSAYNDMFGKLQWNASNIERRLQNIMRNWVVKQEIGGLYEDRLYYELYDLYGAIKEFLQFGAR